ncbi:tryptophan halogenase family protein [Methyloligella sp. 2.7D]|uniref:tryptophan halogenase family protein n=1 Tax=unclassified Methyloligella TaxID=2625955 RepID=UPI00157C6C1E|nr:tryptophan halogenase family protein [Methyloligella sp. GL2]QKP78150.1 tryptophan 7-halogenase [Methyloligella sp. GL2]
MGEALRSITIVGGGTAGWLAAAFLNQFCQSKDAKHRLKITLIESPTIPIVGVGEASLPGMVFLLNQLGISEAEFFEKTDATFKVAAQFINWNHDEKGQPIEFLNILNSPGHIDGHPLADYFVTFDPARNAPDAGLAYARAFSPVTEIVRNNLAPRGPGEPEFSGEVGYTYHFDATKLAAFLRELATGRGVKHILDDVDEVNLDERGFVKSLSLREKGDFPVDLVVDCTGFRGSIVQKALGEPFQSYSDHLLNDRAAVMQIPHKDPNVIAPTTLATGFSAGWNFNIPLTTRVGTGYVFSSRFLSDDEAIDELLAFYGDQAKDAEPRIIPIRTGRVRNAWVKNCVALGLSGGFIEPLEATAIFMTDLGVRWLQHYLPTQDFEPELAAAYNRQVSRVYEEVRDFIQAHYHLNNRQDTEYWRVAREEMKLSDRLKENLKLWENVTPESIDLDTSFLFSSPVYTLLLVAKGFYQKHRLARASMLNRAAYERHRAAMHKARPEQLAGLISHAEFLKTGGKKPVNPFAGFGAQGEAPAFGAASTRIKLQTRPKRPPQQKRRKRR